MDPPHDRGDPGGMSRKRRSHLPGVIFHVTTRTQGHEPWFTPGVRTRITEFIGEAFRRSDADLMAYAVMPNHLHLVLRQGPSPLDVLMQPLLRRIALLVQRVHGTEGHVFERRYGDVPCRDPRHARNVIAYVHLNPVRAGLTTTASAYRWTTRALYSGEPAAVMRREHDTAVDAELGLRLFAPDDGLAPRASRLAYRDYETWRLGCDALRGGSSHDSKPELSPSAPVPPPPPVLAGGDLCWSRDYAPLFSDSPPRPGSATGPDDRTRLDLRDLALRTLTIEAPGVPLDRVRSSDKCRPVVRARRKVVERLDAAGYGGAVIAGYLGVSHQCVSNILAAARTRAARTNGARTKGGPRPNG